MTAAAPSGLAKLGRALLLLLYVPLLVHLVSKGSMRAIDSMSYWQMEPIRTPLYPLFLQPFLGEGPLEESRALAVLQLALGALAILVLCAFLGRRFRLPFGVTWVISLVLAWPYVSIEVGNQILSEGLAYPLFLLFARFALQALLDRSPAAFALASGFTLPLVLTRGQFLFVYPVLAGLLVLLLLDRPGRRAGAFWAGLALVATIAAASLLERAYHAVEHERFVPTPYTGIHLLALPLYVATAEDAARFERDERAFFEECFERLTRRNLTSDSFVQGLVSEDERVSAISKNTKTPRNLVQRGKKRGEDKPDIGRPRTPSPAKQRSDPEQVHGFRGFRMNFQNFTRNFETIVHETIKRHARGRGAEGPEIDDWIEADRLTSSMAVDLVRANPGLWAKFYGMNVLEGLGRRQHGPLLLVAGALAAVAAWRRRSAAARLLAFAAVLALANVLLVALVQPTHVVRYTVYGDVLLGVGVLVALHTALFAVEPDPASGRGPSARSYSSPR